MHIHFAHDWLTGMRGGEKCLAELVELLPDSEIATLVHIPGRTSEAIDRRVTRTSFLSRLPGIERIYRMCLPLYPFAVRELSPRERCTFISLSHAAVKNTPLPAGSRHLCYCFTPMRYIWDQAWTYFGRLTPVLWPILWALRQWDRRASRRGQAIIAISHFVAARIRAFYGIRPEVIYPPVEVERFSGGGAGEEMGGAFLCAGALVPYKRVDIAVRACRELDLPLWIAGDGPEEAALRRIAGPKTRFLGRVDDARLVELYRGCRGLLFPGCEDFGIMPVECMAAGKPVVALYSGGCAETVRGYKPWDPKWNEALEPHGATGVFFRARHRRGSVEALKEALQFFERRQFPPEACREQAARFSSERFRAAWVELLSRQ